MRGLVRDLLAGFRGAWRHGLPVAGARLVRSLRAVPHRVAQRGLRLNPAFRAHQAALGEPDPLLWASHRRYLARGLPVPARLAAAQAHYAHEAATLAAVAADVHGPGLVLWSREAGGVAHDARLESGADVLFEGALSVVLRAGDARACVLSYAVVPRAVLGLPGAGPVPFVTRVHATLPRDRQDAFARAFDRATAAHLAWAALEGVLLAQGFTEALGIAPSRHPSFSPATAARFEAAYGAFWAGLGGQGAGPWGSLVPLPARMTPLDGLDAARRRRAGRRRAHMDEIREAARAALARRLAPPGGGG